MRKANIGNEFWCDGLFHFPIIVSLRDKGSMDRTNGFPFVNVLYEEQSNQSTTGGNKSHLFFLIIAKWNTKRGWFYCLFPNLNKTKRKNKGRYIQRFCVSVVPLSTLRIEETKIGIADHIFIFLFCLWIRKKEKETWLPFLLWNRKTENERTVYTTHGAFPLFHFSSCKGKTKIGVTNHISIFRFSFVD